MFVLLLLQSIAPETLKIEYFDGIASVPYHLDVVFNDNSVEQCEYPMWLKCKIHCMYESNLLLYSTETATTLWWCKTAPFAVDDIPCMSISSWKFAT